jgi:hypothetical protein
MVELVALTFNRYLYAGANPVTLVDPDGHWPWDDFKFDPLGLVDDVSKNARDFANGVGEGVINGLAEIGDGVIAAGGCAIDGACRDSVAASAGAAVERFGNDIARDPVATVTGVGSSVANFATGSVRGFVDNVRAGWSTGNFALLATRSARPGSMLHPSLGLGRGLRGSLDGWPPLVSEGRISCLTLQGRESSER